MTLKERRLAMNMTQDEVAKELDIDQGTVSKWENSESTPLRKYQRKLATLYGCEEDELLEE